MKRVSISVSGAGVLGLWQAFTLARAGHQVVLHDVRADPFAANASRLAAAMIAPECEAEGAPDLIRTLGRQGLALWRAHYPHTVANGTLVVAMPRDQSELGRFARATERHDEIAAEQIAQLEPALAARFSRGLYFAAEGHVEAVRAMTWLLDQIRDAGVEILFGCKAPQSSFDIEIDCRGIAAAGDIANLRGVRGERLIVETGDVMLSRPVRLLHPRQPLYVVPQSENRFVVGATVIEREDDQPVTVKSALDLLGAAYALHPGFGEAKIVEMAAGIRPAFPDNVPRILLSKDKRTLRVNGAYRHGFLLAPMLARAVADYISDGRRGELFAQGD